MRALRRAVVLLAVSLCAAALGGPPPLTAQTTPYVPIDDVAYVDLDVLILRGLVQDVMAAERPYSRAAFRRFVEEADRRLSDGGEEASDGVAAALERLRARFGNGVVERRLERRSAWGYLSAAASPDRELQVGAVRDSIDGQLNPLLQRNVGRVLADGVTAAGEVSFDWSSPRLAVQATPRVALYSEATATTGRAHVTLHDATARTVLGSVAFDLGRTHVAYGFGPEAGPMVSTNPRGFDLLRLSQEKPWRLPGFLSGLGKWQVSGAFAHMGNDHDTPGSILTMARLSWRPSVYFEAGLDYLNHQGGENVLPAAFKDRLLDLFLISPQGDGISDKVLGGDFAVTIPSAGTRLYVHFLTTDDRDFFRQQPGGYWEDAIWTAGFRSLGVGGEGRWGLWGEWRHAGPRPHSHWQFTSGLTLDGRLVGDALGPTAMSLAGGVDWRGPKSRIAIAGYWEHYSGDDWDWFLQNPEDEDLDWYLLADNPDEIRKRLTVDWTRFAARPGIETSVRLGYEHVTRFDFTDENRSNFLAQVSVGYVW